MTDLSVTRTTSLTCIPAFLKIKCLEKKKRLLQIIILVSFFKDKILYENYMFYIHVYIFLSQAKEMARKITICCVAVLLMLTAVAAVPRRVNSIADVPTNVLSLLHWFAQNVNIYSNGIQLMFDPSQGSYGSHYYGNYEVLLETLPQGYQYFTIGNINQDSYPYVHNERNRARIIVRVRRQNNQQADRIYITQHTGNYPESNYDPRQTYEVTANVLRELAQHPSNEIQQRAAGYPFQLQGNAPRSVRPAYSFPNQSYYTSAPRSFSEDSIWPYLCLGFLVLILVVFLIIAGNAKV